MFKVYITSNISATKEQQPTVHAYVFPTPFSDQFSIRIPNDFSPNRIAILDMSGRPIWQKTNPILNELIDQAERFLGNKIPGIYFLKMEDQQGKMATVKVVKMRGVD